MNARIITPCALSGKISAPPSKSFAHRYIIAAFLSGTPTEIIGAGDSDDVYATLGALSSLGLTYEKTERGLLVKRDGYRDGTAYCRESGSTLRFLLPVVCALGLRVDFTGEKSLLSRPINALVETLNSNGAQIDGLSVKGKLKSGLYSIDGSVSSQYVSGLLFALPLLDGDSEIVFKSDLVSKKYVDITLGVLKEFGVKTEKTEHGFFVKGGQKYLSPKTVRVEGDFSGAAFYLAAGALGNKITVTGLTPVSAQGDAQILSVLKDFGAEITVAGDEITVERKTLKGITVDIDPIPDLAQIISVVGAFAKGKTVLKNVSRLRLKESDRIAAIINTLQSAGIKSELAANDLIIYGGNPVGGIFDGGNDHRTVMSASILSCFASGDSEVLGAEAVKKSYPAFYKDFILLGGKVNVDV